VREIDEQSNSQLNMGWRRTAEHSVADHPESGCSDAGVVYGPQRSNRAGVSRPP